MKINNQEVKDVPDGDYAFYCSNKRTYHIQVLSAKIGDDYVTYFKFKGESELFRLMLNENSNLYEIR